MDWSMLISVRERAEQIITSFFELALIKYLLKLSNAVYLRSENSVLEFIRSKIGIKEYVETHGWNILLKSINTEQLAQLREILHEKTD